MDVICRFDETKYVLKVYNNSHGKAVLSQVAQNYMDSMTGSYAERLLLTLEQFGCSGASNRSYAKFGVCLCPIECVDSYYVSEYDGLETPWINHENFLKSLITKHFMNNESLSKEQYDAYVAKSQEVELIEDGILTPLAGGR
jgi:hypothetical protein